jgi:hypothetical protein
MKVAGVSVNAPSMNNRMTIVVHKNGVSLISLTPIASNLEVFKSVIQPLESIIPREQTYITTPI